MLNLDGGTDYRLRLLEQAETYHEPLDDRAEELLAERFATLAPDHASVERDIELEIEGRPIRCRRSADDVAWFDFDALCDGPRSQNDYIELARIYHAVLVSDVPIFTTRIEDQARRFISLVDEFYDHNVKLIVSAAAPVEIACIRVSGSRSNSNARAAACSKCARATTYRERTGPERGRFVVKARSLG